MAGAPTGRRAPLSLKAAVAPADGQFGVAGHFVSDKATRASAAVTLAALAQKDGPSVLQSVGFTDAVIKALADKKSPAAREGAVAAVSALSASPAVRALEHFSLIPRGRLTLLNMSPGRPVRGESDDGDGSISSPASRSCSARFLSLYRRLFGGSAGYWVSAPHAHLRMDALAGCPDEAILAVVEISALTHWKATELHGGSLSVCELIRRGDQIPFSI
ncbi:hypothetical protein A0H81_12051 [Grifola frondosa]|uniref:Uncharacterized protein n=1 Tax=Grifola frondosa TaxID=5627 RepID=A0A1C7LUE6_GRIFR|nr:hypothetical protein A0H81_12051 [Grifola frondosa]